MNTTQGKRQETLRRGTKPHSRASTGDTTQRKQPETLRRDTKPHSRASTGDTTQGKRQETLRRGTKPHSRASPGDTTQEKRPETLRRGTGGQTKSPFRRFMKDNEEKRRRATPMVLSDFCSTFEDSSSNYAPIHPSAQEKTT